MSHILACVVDIDKLFQRLDDVQVVSEVDNNVLRAGVKHIVEQGQCLVSDTETFHKTHLEHMPPVLALVVQTLVEHLHNFHKVASAC